MDTSKDGKTVIRIGPSGSVGPLALDPAMWQRELCTIIGHREFTADELNGLPVDLQTRQVC